MRHASGAVHASGTARRISAAASSLARGPSATADEFNNQYVFWKGTNADLWEGWYNAYTGKWSGPLDLGMGPLNSEPTAVASTTQVFAGPGGKEFNAQFVYWEGLNGSMWMAYWEGSWHGPIQIGAGATGIQAQICSQPSAVFTNPPEGQQIEIYWKGIAGSSGCGGSTGSYLYYAHSTTVNPTAASDYFGPIWAEEAGNIASSPSAASSTVSLPAN